MPISDELKRKRGIIPTKTVTIGFDGYIDEMMHIVENRKNSGEYEPFKSMASFGELILKSNASCGLEMVSVTRKIGGNAPIFADALGCLGVNTTCIGTFGEPELQKPFLETKINNLVSIGNTAYTLALEFPDGKLMLGELESLNKLNWDYLKQKVGLKKLIDYFDKSEIIGITNWSQILNGNNLWEGILDNCMPHLDKSRKRYIFFDLADPSKREKDDLYNAMGIVERYGSYGINILGLNLREAELVYQLYYGDDDIQDDIFVKGRKIMEKLNIKTIIIHSSKFAAAFCDGKVFKQDCMKITNPKLLTGCGDNFNAGFCLGLLLGLTTDMCLKLGTKEASYYISNGKSPNFDELLNFISEEGE